MSALKLVRITCAEDAVFRDALAIYEVAIPISEQKTRAQIIAGLKDPAFRFWALERHGDVVAVAIFYVSDAQNFALLEYMAVSPAFHGQGLGSEMFRLSWEASRLDTETVLLIEVDSEAEETSAEERRIRLSRKQFYRRLGCVEIQRFRYIFPLRNFGAPPQMNLLVAGTMAGTMPVMRLRHAVEDVYRNVYQCPADDARIAEMFSAGESLLHLV